MEPPRTKSQKPDNLYDKNAPVWKLLRKERKPFDFLADIEKTFLQFDLSRNEIRVYLYLARSGIKKLEKFQTAFLSTEPRPTESCETWRREVSYLVFWRNP